jgi:hypothetical protein
MFRTIFDAFPFYEKKRKENHTKKRGANQSQLYIPPHTKEKERESSSSILLLLFLHLSPFSLR